LISPQSKSAQAKGTQDSGKGGAKSKKIKLGAKGKILTLDEKIRDTNKSVTKTV
jgi:hypothetical protein